MSPDHQQARCDPTKKLAPKSSQHVTKDPVSVAALAAQSTISARTHNERSFDKLRMANRAIEN